MRGILQERRLALDAGRAELPPPLGVAHGDGQSALGRADRCRRDADASADQRADDREEPRPGALDGADVRAVRFHASEAVEQRRAVHAHVVEPHPAVVHAVLAHLRAVVLDADAGQEVARLVAQRHDERMDAVALAVAGFELGENGGGAAVAHEVADVVLAGGETGAADDELPGGGFVAGQGFEFARVGAVADLGQREAARQREGADVAQVAAVVLGAAEQKDAARPQAELHGELDRQADVVERDGLERRRERGVVPPSAVLDRN